MRRGHDSSVSSRNIPIPGHGETPSDAIPGIVVAAMLLTAPVPVWLPLAVAVDLVRLRTRLPTVRLLMVCRHASRADSLVSAWVVTIGAGMHPRYVLKRELLADPCLDVVGNRLPNHFGDRGAADSATELVADRAVDALLAGAASVRA